MKLDEMEGARRVRNAEHLEPRQSLRRGRQKLISPRESGFEKSTSALRCAFNRTHPLEHSGVEGGRGVGVKGVQVGGEAERCLKEGGCKATWKREFKLPWRKAGLLKSSK